MMNCKLNMNAVVRLATLGVAMCLTLGSVWAQVAPNEPKSGVSGPQSEWVGSEPQSETGSRLPMTVTLTAVRLAGGVTQVDATLRISARLDGVVTLRLELPEGALLLDGLQQEMLGELPPETVVHRQFLVALSEGEMTLKAVSAGPAMGAAAWATWPESSPESQQGTESEPIPEVNYHGIPIRKAVRLK